MRAANVVNATGVWADELRPQELHDEAELPRIRPSRGTHVTLAPRGPAAHRRGDRAGRRGALDLRAAVARAHARRHDRQRLRGAARPRRALAARTSTTCSTAINAFFGTALAPRRPHRRLRGRAPADLHRRPEEVGGHLAQGRAVRDLLGHDHDHRRQAHDLAADGEDDRRPARRARSPRRPLPHARDPARPGDRRRGAAARGGRGAGGLRRARRPLRPRRARRCSRSRPSAASWRSRSSRACPTCSPRSRSRRATSRRAASATCCCAARASACSPRDDLVGAPATRRAELRGRAVERVAEVLARRARLERRAPRARASSASPRRPGPRACSRRGARAARAPVRHEPAR